MADTVKPSFWAILPADVRYDKSLRPNAKLLYAEIQALSGTEGYCWAENDYLAKLYGMTTRSVTSLVSQLAERGYVRVEVIRDENTNEVLQRRIWPARNEAQIFATPPEKNVVTPPEKNFDYINNNIYYNPPIVPPEGGGTRKTRKTKSAPDWKPDRFAGFWQFYPRGENKQGAIRAWDRLKPSDSDLQNMALALSRQMQSSQWQEGIGIPYASTWLNQRRWEDEVRQPIPAMAAAEPEGAYRL